MKDPNPPISSMRIAFKEFIALLGFSAIITEIATLVERGNFVAADFFSYFTIQNNILAAVTLLLSALLTAAHRGSRLDVLRGAVTVYMLVVGIGFAVLLNQMEEGVALTAVPWDNVVLHYLMPLGMLVDYLVDRPRRRLFFAVSLTWLAYPIAYLAYTMVRGASTGWYPYPFLNPDTQGSAAVVGTVLGLLVLTIGLIWCVCALSPRRRVYR